MFNAGLWERVVVICCDNASCSASVLKFRVSVAGHVVRWSVVNSITKGLSVLTNVYPWYGNLEVLLKVGNREVVEGESNPYANPVG